MATYNDCLLGHMRIGVIQSFEHCTQTIFRACCDCFHLVTHIQNSLPVVTHILLICGFFYTENS